MRRYSITYFIGQSIKGLWRNGVMSTASIMVLMSCLTVLGAFTLLVYNIDHNLEQLGVLNDITVSIDTEKTDAEFEAICEQIRALDNVQSIVVKHKTTVYEEAKSDFDKFPSMFQMMEERGDNPLPYRVEVTYKDNTGVATLEYQLEHIDGITAVSSRYELADKIESVKNGVVIVFIWFLIILFVVSIFVIINTIKLAVFARRQEISIMRYVGATNWFITLPFVFEGILMGLISSSLAFFIEWYSYNYICKMIVSDYNMLTVVPFDELKIIVLIGFVAIGIVTGVIGSVISLSKYLRA